MSFHSQLAESFPEVAHSFREWDNMPRYGFASAMSEQLRPHRALRELVLEQDNAITFRSAMGIATGNKPV